MGPFDIWSDKEVMEADFRQAPDYTERDSGTQITRTVMGNTDYIGRIHYNKEGG